MIKTSSSTIFLHLSVMGQGMRWGWKCLCLFLSSWLHLSSASSETQPLSGYYICLMPPRGACLLAYCFWLSAKWHPKIVQLFCKDTLRSWAPLGAWCTAVHVVVLFSPAYVLLWLWLCPPAEGAGLAPGFAPLLAQMHGPHWSMHGSWVATASIFSGRSCTEPSISRCFITWTAPGKYSA